MVTREDVYAMLKGFGLDKKSVVMMHTSLKAIGEIEGRAEGLLSYFCDYLSEGLFMVPTGTWSCGDTFDVKNTMPCTGTFTQICARAAFERPDGARSLHPTHSVAAFGPRAKEYVKGEEKFTTPTPAGSTWSRLYEEGGKILLVGVGFNRNTYLHAIDEELDIPGRLIPREVEKEIIREDGSRLTVKGHFGHGFNAWDKFFNYEKPLTELGCVAYGTLGNAKVTCMDVKKSRPIIYRMWERADYDLCAELKEIPEELYR